MSERSERIISTAPKAHGCATPSVSGDLSHEGVAHQCVYAVFEVEVHDDRSEAYAAYRAAVPALIERFGGRYLARAATGHALEGTPTTGRWHLVEFPSADAADGFWSCPEYVELKRLRADAASVRAVVIEGA